MDADERVDLLAGFFVYQSYNTEIENLADEQDLNVIFTTERDDDVCPVCGLYDGMAFVPGSLALTLYSPPLHPNCRCTLEVGE